MARVFRHTRFAAENALRSIWLAGAVGRFNFAVILGSKWTSETDSDTSASETVCEDSGSAVTSRAVMTTVLFGRV